MLSYAHGADDRPLIGQTIGDFFDAISKTPAGHEALVSCHQGIRWTYGELRDRVDELGRALIALGTHKGDRVGIWSTNVPEWVVTQFAVARVGAVLVNINPAYRLHELEKRWRRPTGDLDRRQPLQGVEFRRDDRPRLCPEVADRRRRHGTRRSSRALRRLIALGPAGPAGAYHGAILEAGPIDGTWPIASGRRVPHPTSRTSSSPRGRRGSPRGRRSHPSILMNAYTFGRACLYRPGPRLYPGALLPLLRVRAGAHWCSSRHGATIVVPRRSSTPVRPSRPSRRSAAPALHGVPTMFIAELDHPDFGRSTPRACGPALWAVHPARSRSSSRSSPGCICPTS